MKRKHGAAWAAVLVGLLAVSLAAADDGTWTIDNGIMQLGVEVRGGRIVRDWLQRLDGSGPGLRSDGGFALELTWTDWSAPGKAQNADNPVILGPDAFLFEKTETLESAGGRELRLFFHGDKKSGNSLRLALVYSLEPGRFWTKRRLELSDPTGPRHFLRSLCPLAARLEDGFVVVKEGGFGQPVALAAVAEAGTPGGGAFLALEYPAAENRLETVGGKMKVRCGQEIGERVGPQAIVSDWAVAALTPDERVKHWFFAYLDSVRVAPLRPYTLYNSWYDLRSPVYPKVTPPHVMNEANVRRIIGLLRENMVDRHGIRLDAFVLDDGWDVYASDWELRRDQFPNGLQPIAAELAKTGTRLGIWFGPTGGYSFRKERLQWMRERGYEIVGDQLCLAGSTYGALFKKRVLDFVGQDGVGYFKWDGIQFSCSEPGHGHAVDLYSRRAVMETVAGLCREARAADPGMFLNITSGTWLSPWWLRFADQIWMGGEDYGWADVPSLSPRDAAITYRDSVLYDDFRVQDLWFPVANLMTHGIIKGRLQMLGGEDEPLEKFTDETMMYAARGVSMFELYVSPDLLSEGEWAAMAGALRWARDRFGLLRRTEMVGGDPRRGQAYGYVHADGKRAVIVARNPLIEPQELRIGLDPALGFDAGAGQLVLERVYPTRFIDPRLRAAGEELKVALDGFETAIYELFPVAEARRPLLAGALFSGAVGESGSRYTARCYGAKVSPGLLNDWPSPASWSMDLPATSGGIGSGSMLAAQDAVAQAACSVEVPASAREPQVAWLLKPDEARAGAPLPAARVFIDGVEAPVRGNSQAGAWSWSAAALPAGKHRVELRLQGDASGRGWSGKAVAWLIGREAMPAMQAEWNGLPTEEPPMPPRPWPEGEFRRQLRIGEQTILLN
ncbi:MAG: alpha-galactosidase [Acidobacteria bacterium]|jgi:hypothetical protein|nr:alpha-galactosidase [Acidobacteriota bacterium]